MIEIDENVKLRRTVREITTPLGEKIKLYEYKSKFSDLDELFKRDTEEREEEKEQDAKFNELQEKRRMFVAMIKEYLTYFKTVGDVELNEAKTLMKTLGENWE